jgi:hypothetical protein
MSYRVMALVAASLLFATPSYAATTVNASKSNTFKVTAANAQARTFTATSKDGKQFTFIAPKGMLLAVGKTYNITYTETPGGGPLQTTTVKVSKSDSTGEPADSKNLNSSRSNIY